MNKEDLNEITILLDNYTLIKMKMQQLDMNKPRPQNYYDIWESLNSKLQSAQDLLLETLFAKNAIKISTKTIGNNE